MKSSIKVILWALCAFAFLNWNSAKAQLIESFSIGYWGDMGIHPGANVNVYMQLRETTRTKKRKGKTIERQMLLAPSLHYFSLPFNHSGMGLGTELQWERTKKKKWYRYGKAGIFYHTRFNSGTTYFVDQDVDPVVAGTRGYALGGLGGGIGRYLPVIPIDLSLGVNAYFIGPYNSVGFVPMPSLEFKLRYTL